MNGKKLHRDILILEHYVYTWLGRLEVMIIMKGYTPCITKGCYAPVYMERKYI